MIKKVTADLFSTVEVEEVGDGGACGGGSGEVGGGDGGGGPGPVYRPNHTQYIRI